MAKQDTDCIGRGSSYPGSDGIYAARARNPTGRPRLRARNHASYGQSVLAVGKRLNPRAIRHFERERIPARDFEHTVGRAEKSGALLVRAGRISQARDDGPWFKWKPRFFEMTVLTPSVISNASEYRLVT
jgi:hypothetical protein